MKEGFMITKIPVILFILILLILAYGCSGDRSDSGKEITVNISANNTIVVEADTVALDSLAWKLKELGVTKNTRIRVNPHPVAGAATVEKVQRIISVVKSSIFDK
jgi:biopolymer transport protein ExbD